ncbi:MAG: hypothetical protein IPP62_07390 [bacterium]|nr:hypothetical protein [bacterium]
MFIEDGYSLASANVTVNGYDYMVRNPVHRAGGELYFFYQDTLADAVTLALALAPERRLDAPAPGPAARSTSPTACIQPAIDAAVPGTRSRSRPEPTRNSSTSPRTTW